MRLKLLLPLAVAAAVTIGAPAGAFAASPPPIAPAEFVPGEVIVHYKDGASRRERAHVQREAGTGDPELVAADSRKLEILDGESVRETVAELEHDPTVAYAVPNYIARASAFYPNDPGRGGPGAWQSLQWNFLAAAGVNAPEAWARARARGAPGGRGAVVAVLDTGAAYRTRGVYRQAPDLANTRFVKPYDFVGNDPYPNDANGHGTHVTGTIAQSTNNGRAVTGLAYGASIMPIQILDKWGEGDAAAITRALRYATGRGADVINLSLEFGQGVRAAQIPDVISAIRRARRQGAVVVGASGNEAGAVAYPARTEEVIAVGATTHHACRADYSNGGSGLDLVAPGGGSDAAHVDNLRDAQNCRPGTGERSIYQQTFTSGVRQFGLPSDYIGTSMAAAHVSATAALIIGTRRLGANPTPAAVERRLEATARDLGPVGRDGRYGAGLLNAAWAIGR